ncbi:sodium-potassium ATPase [Auriscalpium vulgare]|uniref:Sodium-potassium ATPase n=1 Tax=Auriscalpium vulgare TaxID=40419 RepID=A0ACB8RLS4_9AGAM|nr:sodium-potassium ATPase [Auriscalpium vulgare]
MSTTDPEAHKPTLPRTITIEARHPDRPSTGIPLGARTLSIGARTLSRHEPIAPSSRLPIEFRTLSLRVEHTGDPIDFEARDKSAAVKGEAKALNSLDWHKISLVEALQRLSVSPQTGLDAAQATRRSALYGANQISPPPSRMFRKVIGWVFGGFGSLLLAGGIVCFICWKPLGNPHPDSSNLALACVLLVVVALQAVFNAWQDFSTSRVMASIKDMLPADVLVLRDGLQTTIPAAMLVPGDLVYVVMGQKVPADMRLVEVTSDLRFDRSVLTGESEAVSGRLEKTDDNILETKNIALQGTLCVNGSGLGLVIQIGDNTVFGRIAKMSSASPTQLTTMQREILRFVIIIGSLAFSLSVVIVIIWAAWLKPTFPHYITTSTLLIDVVSIMIAFIPEGLPMTVTVSLAKVAHTLSQHKVLCKSLSIVETLGSVNVLCSDKTGTLTQNKMHVENVAMLDVSFTPASLKDHLTTGTAAITENLRQILAVSALCNSATFEVGTGEKERTIIGDATDSAILAFADGLDGVHTARSTWKHVHKMNFNSRTKYMLTLSKLIHMNNMPDPPPAPLASWDGAHADDLLLCVKGAPDVLLPRCTHTLDPAGGPPRALSHATQHRIVGVQERWAAQGRRVLVLARRLVSHHVVPKNVDPFSEEFEAFVEEATAQLVIVGLLGLIDPLKPDIPETVRICRGAGIRFFIVTGDHPATAVAIAAQAGIISNAAAVHHYADLVSEDTEKAADASDQLADRSPQSIVISGSELDMVTTHAVMDRLCAYEEIVFARTTPEQKLRIVQAFQARDSIVAMTGDGVNDAPSLRAADCGIAMGGGSDVAREAADMVLLEDFSAIVVALEYGRLVFDNLKKSILYLLPAGSFSELMPILLNILLGLPQLLSNIQMIVICIATDVLPALSMCFEPPESGLLSRPPRNTHVDRLADWKLYLHAYGFLGIIESLCAFAMSLWYLQRRGLPFSSLVLGFGNWPGLTDELLHEAQSIYFFTLIIMQWGNLLASRTRKSSILQQPPSWGINRTTVPAALIALAIGIFFSYPPFFHTIFKTHGIPAEYFFLPMAFGLGMLILDEIRKLTVRTYPKGVLAKIAW